MITMRAILRGALTRVAPGFLLGSAVLIGASSVARSNITAGRILTLFLVAGTAAIGSTLALTVMRRRLRDDAGVDGRRAFLVGLLCVPLSISVRPFLPHIGTAAEFALLALSGAALSSAVFFPWLATRRADVASHERV